MLDLAVVALLLPRVLALQPNFATVPITCLVLAVELVHQHLAVAANFAVVLVWPL